MIENRSSMDRPLAPRGNRRLVVVGLCAGLLLAVALGLVLPAFGRLRGAERSVDRGLLRFAEVTRGDLLHDVAVQGRAVAASRPTLFSPSSGTAVVLVEEGDAVSKAQVLVRIESPELRNRLQQEEARLASLRSSFGRQGLLVRRTGLENEQAVDLLRVRSAAAERAVARNEEMRALGILNELDHEAARDELAITRLELEHALRTAELGRDVLAFELDDARLSVERQELVVAEARRQVNQLEVRAPFTGLVATVEIDDRDAVVAGQPLLGVLDPEALEIDVNIPETYADDVTPGLRAEMTVEGRRHEGVLTRVGAEVRGGQVTGRVVFVGGIPEGLRQNQRVTTRLVLDRREAVLKLPRGPFLESGGGRLVYVVDDRMARRRGVDLGVVSVTEIEVLTGLHEGERIVLSDVGRFEGADSVLLTH